MHDKFILIIGRYIAAVTALVLAALGI